MKIDTSFLSRCSSTVMRSSLLQSHALWIGVILLALGSYAGYEVMAYSSGITGQTQKSSSPGCTCHCSSSSSATNVSVTTSATTFETGNSYTFTVTTTNSGENYAGLDVAVYRGSLSSITGQGTQLSNGEITHTSPKVLGSNGASWQFTYNTPSTTGWDTIYVTSNAVNRDYSNGGGNCTDEWNHASKFIIQVTSAPTTTKILGVGRTTVNMGSVRVGKRRADSLIVRSTGTAALTVNSSAMKSGAQFSTYPTGSNRSIAAGGTEMDSVIFTPSARGSYTDSLIINTNADAASDQRKAIYVTGTGIQGVFTPGLASIAFGNLRVGRTSRIAYTYQNTGDDSIFLSSPGLSGSGYSIVSGPSKLGLAPNERDTVVVQFAPLAKSAYGGTLSFSASNGVTTPSVTITGAGTIPTLQLVSSSPAGLGGVRVGQSLTGNFLIRNTGNDTLHISGATLTSSGTKFSLGSYDQVVLPGAQGAFSISYTASAETIDSATLRFNSDDPLALTTTATVTAAGTMPHMLLAYPDTVDVGQIKVGANTTRNFLIQNTGSDNLVIYSAVVSPTPLFSLAGKPTDVGPGSSGQLSVKFSPTAVGTFTGKVIVSGDDPNNGSDTIYLKGSGINSALGVPTTLDFGLVNVAANSIQQVAMTNTGAADVHILGYKLTSAFPVFVITDSAAHTVGANGTANVAVKFTPAAALAYTATLTITTDDANAPIRTVALSGSGAKGALSLSTTTLEFGTVDTGSSVIKSVYVKNTGTAPISLTSFSATGSHDFTVVGTEPPSLPPFTIAAGDSLKVNIQFKPTVDGPITASVSFTTSDNATSTLNLNGYGHIQQSGVSEIAKVFASRITISPNPARNSTIVRLETATNGVFTITLFDATGRLIRQMESTMWNVGDHQIGLDLTSLASGTYFVRVSAANGVATESRLILER